jgi:hypothetical protein
VTGLEEIQSARLRPGGRRSGTRTTGPTVLAYFGGIGQFGQGQDVSGFRTIGVEEVKGVPASRLRTRLECLPRTPPSHGCQCTQSPDALHGARSRRWPGDRWFKRSCRETSSDPPLVGQAHRRRTRSAVSRALLWNCFAGQGHRRHFWGNGDRKSHGDWGAAGRLGCGRAMNASSDVLGPPKDIP